MNSKNWPTKKLEEITRDEVENKLRVALNLLYKNDVFLLKRGKETERGANERSVSHKLAEYLHGQFPDWHVDCEYNRHGLKIKNLEGKKVYPDIVVHHRNFDDNLLVIELKTSKDENREDIEKLEKFTDQNGDYKYRFGVFIRLDAVRTKELLWFELGQQKNQKR